MFLLNIDKDSHHKNLLLIDFDENRNDFCITFVVFVLNIDKDSHQTHPLLIDFDENT